MTEGDKPNDDNYLLQDDQASQKKYTIDQAFDKIGGFSKIKNDHFTPNSLNIDRYHVFVSIVLSLGYTSGAAVMYQTSFL